MSLRVNATSSIAGLIFPGDRVDIILTHSVKAGGPRRRVSETVLTNVRILAIDQKTNDQSNAPKVGKNARVEILIKPKKKDEVAPAEDENGEINYRMPREGYITLCRKGAVLARWYAATR